MANSTWSDSESSLLHTVIIVLCNPAISHGFLNRSRIWSCLPLWISAVTYRHNSCWIWISASTHSQQQRENSLYYTLKTMCHLGWLTRTLTLTLSLFNEPKNHLPPYLVADEKPYILTITHTTYSGWLGCQPLWLLPPGHLLSLGTCMVMVHGDGVVAGCIPRCTAAYFKFLFITSDKVSDGHLGWLICYIHSPSTSD